MSERTGFLDESPGVRSMARLTILLCLVLASPLVGTLCFYVLRREQPDAAVIGGLVGGLGTLIGGGAVAIIKRNGGE